jgi:hypothetical protein
MPPMRLNPAFRRHPDEAAIVGRLVVGFGEIELAVCRNAGNGLGNYEVVMRALYKQRATSGRVDTADALIESAYADAGLAVMYASTMDMVRYCLKVRNHYAHCNWADDPNGSGLFFADLQVSADSPPGQFEHLLRHVDVPLLEAQEVYFSNTLEWLDFIRHELAVSQGLVAVNVWPRPPELSQPPLHNPPDQHVPPWLNEDQKALHLARARAAQGGPPTPTPAQQALDKAREEKRAHKQAQRERSERGEDSKERFVDSSGDS